MADVKRPAPEGRRQKRARQTRRSILAAAHELFVRQGYARTTIQQIADQADVAWQTVYAVFGGKPAILSAVFDVAVAGDDEPVPVPERPFVRAIAVRTVTRMQTVPMKKQTYIQYGTPLLAFCSSAGTFCRPKSDRFARTAPAPVNMLWVRKPRASCDFGSRSEMNAR